MIIDYDHNPNATVDQKLQSLRESIQLALNEIESNGERIRKEIGNIEDTLIGTVLTGASLATTVNSGTKTNTNSIDIPSGGVWLIVFQAALPLGANAQFQATITTTYDIAAEQQSVPVSGLVRLNMSAIVNGGQAVYGTIYHTNGSALTINTNSLTAIRLGI